ncbi:MAG TPA: serine/threonine-protein kinase [Blastocatellia bacterium]|nr:serine/threonine-protein kinase [Blastocatellia bacterium]
MLEADTVIQGRYRIISQIAKGGMGIVYLARDENLGVTVAVKQNFFNDQRLIEAFKREARLLAGLRHASLPQVKDYFINEVGQFLVMEYIAGNDLGAILEKRQQKIAPVGKPKPFEVGEVVQWAEQLLDALDYLHTLPEPVIHRDIKPQNLKLAGRNQIILLDFGLAKGKPQWVTRVTSSGSIYGYTPNYAPLEQIRGLGTDPRSDLYGLGATLYHLLTGVPPVDAATRADAFIGNEPDPLLAANEVAANVPREVAAVLAKALEQHRNQRPASAAEMLELLRTAKLSTVIDRPAGENTEITPVVEFAAREEDAWLPTEIGLSKQAEQEEREAQQEAESRRRAEQEHRATEAATLAFDQERQTRDAAAMQPSEERLQEPQAKARIATESKAARHWKAALAVIAGVALLAVLAWAIVNGLGKSNKPKAGDEADDGSGGTTPARLKAGVRAIPNKVYEVSFSDDGRLLASAGEEAVVRLWQTDGEKQLAGRGGVGKCVAVSPDGATLASGSSDNVILLWRASDGQALKTLTGHSDRIFSIGFSPDGQTLFSASDDRTVRLWRVSDGGLIKTVSTPEKGYLIVTVSPDLRLVAYYRPGSPFKLWSLEANSQVRLLKGKVPEVYCGAFSRDGQVLALGSTSGEVQLWRVSDGRLLQSLGEFKARVNSIAFSANGKLLAAGFDNGTIRLWRVSGGEFLVRLPGHTESVNSVSFSADGRTLASGSDDNTVRIWEIAEN